MIEFARCDRGCWRDRYAQDVNSFGRVAVGLIAPTGLARPHCRDNTLKVRARSKKYGVTGRTKFGRRL